METQESVVKATAGGQTERKQQRTLQARSNPYTHCWFSDLIPVVFDHHMGTSKNKARRIKISEQDKSQG